MKLGLFEIAVAAFQILFVRGGYYTQDDELPDGGVTKYLKRETKVSCLLKCDRDKNCDNIMFKLENKEVRNGECWFVKNNATDTAEDIQKLKKDIAIEGYKKTLPTKASCKFGYRVITNTSKEMCKCKGEWILLKNYVCFGARANEFGTFKIQHDAVIIAIKLVHVSGKGVKCSEETRFTKWGCDIYYPFNVENVAVVVTDDQDNVLYPSMKYHVNHGFFNVSGYNANSPYLIYNATSHTVHKGQEMRLHYGEALLSSYSSNNSGESCADIYAKLCDE
ncbi:uncharacterized protein LOC130657602 [Hydractinia symbiolongicarpus]|uniref:uncharacterized protein LOC130657602 n=1 Tax=Hydractinia symbiolongicarpus TaxID=13093 RepID=UPI00254CFD51|nr:uncharacterized protein LOC130657602 [Hydractinia symbiolongicarpus]